MCGLSGRIGGCIMHISLLEKRESDGKMETSRSRNKDRIDPLEFIFKNNNDEFFKIHHTVTFFDSRRN